MDTNFNPFSKKKDRVAATRGENEAVGYTARIAARMPRDAIVVINVSGRGDKDCVEVARLTGRSLG